MKAAIIKNGIVVNIAKASTEFAEAQGWIISDTARIGDIYDADTGEFTPAPQPPEPVPAVVTRRQAKQQLAASGMLSYVQPAIDAIEDDAERVQMQIYWDDSAVFERDHPQLNDLAERMGITQAQIDDLYREGAQR